MVIIIALIISVILQFLAFFITISLIPKTKFKIAWISISVGFLLMAFRRATDLYTVINAGNLEIKQLVNVWVAVTISISMFTASFYIRKIFELLNRLNDLRKENEKKVLSAIISTEEKERKHFAKELHDGLGPILSSMKMSLSAIDLSVIDDENKEIILKTETNIDNAITSTKEISNHLNPQVLERFGPEKALQTFISNMLLSKEIKADVSIRLQKKRFPYNTEVVLYRVICELFNNTIKHAEASAITLIMRCKNNRLKCRYKDDGIGFDIDSVESKGMGILNMQSRVKSVGGTLEINSAAGQGVYVTIVLPV